MNFKKTWLGYINFILSGVFVSACVIVLIYSYLAYEMKDYFSNPSSDIVKSQLNIHLWNGLLIGVAVVCILSQIYYLIRKFREFLCSKKSFFETDSASERFGGIICFLIFTAGLFLRVKAIIDKNTFSMDIKSSVNTLNIQALFDRNSGLDFSSFEAFYDSTIAFVYKFTGIKDSVYLWVNFAFHIILIHLVFLAVMHLYNASVAIVPMAFICLHPENIKLVATGGYENIKRIIVALVFLLAVLFVSIFRKAKHYNVISLIMTFTFEFVCLIGLPWLITDGFETLPVFKFELNDRLYDFFLYESLEGLFLVVFALIFIAALSFYYSDCDKLLSIFPLWISVTAFFVFSDAAWSTPFYTAIITTVFAGIGIDELLTSKIILKLQKESEKTPRKEPKVIIVEKPETKEIILPGEDTVSKQTFETPEQSDQTAVVSGETVPESTPENCSPETTEAFSKEITETADKPAVELFESPLPLPKKHKKKEITFKFEPSDDKMYFDIEIPDGDDFDV